MRAWTVCVTRPCQTMAPVTVAAMAIRTKYPKAFCSRSFFPPRTATVTRTNAPKMIHSRLMRDGNAFVESEWTDAGFCFGCWVLGTGCWICIQQPESRIQYPASSLLQIHCPDHIAQFMAEQMP